MRLSFIVEHWMQMPPFGLAALNLLAAALLAVVGPAWARHGRRRLLAASAFVCVAAIVVLYVFTVQPNEIPTDWITVLTRGFERKSIMHLYARGAHAGANFGFVTAAVGAGAPSLYDVVWLNLLLALVNAAVFAHVAFHVAPPAWALVWTAVFALNPATFLASFSELPANLLSTYFLAGLVGWAVLTDALPQPRAIRVAAAALCVLLTILVAYTRLEVALIGVVALTLCGAHRLLGARRWSELWQGPRRIGERLLAFLSDHPALVVLLTVIAVQGPWVTSREEFAALYPFNASFLGLFVSLPMLGLPIGVGVAVFFGFVRGLLSFRQFGGLVLSLFVIVRVYFGVFDSYFEMRRFLSYVMFAIVCLGLFGKEQLDATIMRLRPNWQRLARVVYIMSWVMLPLPGVLEFYLRADYTPVDTVTGGVSQLLPDRNVQREVRHLLSLAERNPQCVFVGRVLRDQGDFRNNPTYDYAVFGAPIASPIFIAEKEAALDEVVGRHAAGASCVRLHYGSDCNVRLGDGCKAFIAGRRLIEEERFWSRPYNSNPWDEGAPEIILATYAWE